MQKKNHKVYIANKEIFDFFYIFYRKRV